MATPTDVDAVFSLATEFATSFEVDKRPFLESFHQVMSDDHALLLVAAEGEEVAKLVALATRRAAEFYRSVGYEESATYFRKLL